MFHYMDINKSNFKNYDELLVDCRYNYIQEHLAIEGQRHAWWLACQARKKKKEKTTLVRAVVQKSRKFFFSDDYTDYMKYCEGVKPTEDWNINISSFYE